MATLVLGAAGAAIGGSIGGAILVDGVMQRGRYGIAGEFGHMQVVPGGIRCECGNRGCWEQYSSGNALVREARGLIETDDAARGAIRENIDALHLFGVTRVHRRDATDLGPRPASAGAPFDIAFLDPARH